MGDLPLETQVKLLRLLQEREYTPLGGVETLQANVRIVAATNRDLSTLVSQGRFRDDLYFRLAVVRLTIPSLARRREDVPYLVEHFVQRFNAKQGKRVQGVTPAVMQILMRHDFPGNVRELENIIEYAFVLCRNGLIDVCHLPDDLKGAVAAEGLVPARVTALQESEASAIRQAVSRNAGHLGRTARELGISRTTLWRKMKKYGIRSGPR